jgi:hypothetical protein
VYFRAVARVGNEWKLPLPQAARTLVASGVYCKRKRQKVNATTVLKEQNKKNISLKFVAKNPKIVSKA